MRHFYSPRYYCWCIFLVIKKKSMSVSPNPATTTGEPLSTVNKVLEVGASLTQVSKCLYCMRQPHTDGQVAGLCSREEHLRPP
jgi:hypothetical protein